MIFRSFKEEGLKTTISKVDKNMRNNLAKFADNLQSTAETSAF